LTPLSDPFSPWDLLLFGGAAAFSVLLIGVALITVYGLWLALLGWSGNPRARTF
jgi:hypothetical protein